MLLVCVDSWTTSLRRVEARLLLFVLPPWFPTTFWKMNWVLTHYLLERRDAWSCMDTGVWTRKACYKELVAVMGDWSYKLARKEQSSREFRDSRCKKSLALGQGHPPFFPLHFPTLLELRTRPCYVWNRAPETHYWERLSVFFMECGPGCFRIFIRILTSTHQAVVTLPTNHEQNKQKRLYTLPNIPGGAASPQVEGLGSGLHKDKGFGKTVLQ